MTFKWGQQLTTSEVFYAAVGMILKSHYINPKYIQDEEGIICCVCTKKAGAPENLPNCVVQYYPGKDNELKNADTTKPLSSILSKAQAHPEYKATDLKDACHMMIVGQSNLYLGFSIRGYDIGVRANHYVLAEFQNGQITIRDSIQRSYETAPIKTMINQVLGASTVRLTSNDDDNDDDFYEFEEVVPTEKSDAQTIKRGTQSMVMQDWQCGFHVIRELDIKFNGEPFNAKFVVTNDIVKQYEELYISVAKPAILEQEEESDAVVTFDDEFMNQVMTEIKLATDADAAKILGDRAEMDKSVTNEEDTELREFKPKNN